MLRILNNPLEFFTHTHEFKWLFGAENWFEMLVFMIFDIRIQIIIKFSKQSRTKKAEEFRFLKTQLEFCNFNAYLLN